MARAILVAAALVLLASCSGARHASQATASAKPVPCPDLLAKDPSDKLSDDQDDEYREFRESVEAGAFFRKASSDGELACSVEVREGMAQLDYRGTGGVHLVARRSPAIEASEQQLVVPDTPFDEALAIARNAETDFFGDSRCGIDWSAPTSQSADAGTERAEYRGSICSCSATITVTPKIVTTIAFSSAC